MAREARTSVATLREIDAVCDRFEAEWRSGTTPRIEDYVAGNSNESRNDLLAALLRLDYELAGARALPRRSGNTWHAFPMTGESCSGRWAMLLWKTAKTTGLTPSLTTRSPNPH
jgi:hypothetical protein